MHVLLLSCSTGEGHNHCARAVRQALEAMGHETDFFDLLHLFGDPGPIGIEGLLNVISTKAPNLFGLMYKAGERVSALGVTSPVYVVNMNYGRKLCDLINERGYDAVVCSHLFPMETLTFIRRWFSIRAKCSASSRTTPASPSWRRRSWMRISCPTRRSRKSASVRASRRRS